MGTVVVKAPTACTSPAVGLSPGKAAAEADVWAVVPVPGKPGAVTLVAKARAAGCARFLSAPVACTDTQLLLTTTDDDSGRQQWQVLQAGAAASPPPAASPSPSPAPIPVPAPPA